MAFNSLLWLQSSIKTKINPNIIKDLGLYELYEKLIALSEHNEVLIYELCVDEPTIIYRQGILKDFVAQPQLLNDLVMNLESIYELKAKLNTGKYSTTHFYALVNLVMTVDATVKCLDQLNETLQYYKLESKGLNSLKDDVTGISSSIAFKSMKNDLKEIRYILGSIRSSEISVNISESNRPTEAQVTDFNDYSYKYPKAFRKVSDALDQENNFFGIYMKNYNPEFKINTLNWDILDELEYAFKKHIPTLSRFLDNYQQIDISPYIALLHEVTFYQSSYDLISQLSKHKMPLCMPTLLKADKREMHIKGLYNVRTTFRSIGHNENNVQDLIILNDFDMDSSGRIFILTGANRGGKTTFTQAIGQIQVLAQLGLMVPAKEASLSLVDQLLTHFPVLEKETVTLGRLGKECQMFSELFKKATSHSLFLMNESFSGTSYLESLEIAQEVTKALKHRCSRVVFNTHLHELAKTSAHLNDDLPNDTLITSLIAERIDDHSTYKVVLGEPLGKSYAYEIAKKYGVTYKQLIKKSGGSTLDTE